MNRWTLPAMALVAACSTAALVEPKPTVHLIPPGEVALAEGQTVEVALPSAPSALRVTFLEVVSDTRCPTKVSCVWEGDAAVRLALSGESSGEITLHYPGATIGPTYADSGQYRIELRAVNPLPEHPDPRKRDYRITIGFAYRQ